MKITSFRENPFISKSAVLVAAMALDLFLATSLVIGQNFSKNPMLQSHEEWLSREKIIVGYHRDLPGYTTTTPFSIYKVNQYPDASPQNEPSVRINPKNVDNIVAAYRDFHLGWETPAIRNVSIAATTDGGKTWTEQFANYLDHNRYTDPAVGVDLNGNFTVATLDWHDVNSSQESTMVSVRKSSDGGLTWLPAVPAGPFGSNYDKNMIGVDEGLMSPYRGNIYVAWDGVLSFARSTDTGTSFSLAADSPYVTYPAIATGPNGEVYIVGLEGWGKKSTDGGLNFSDYHVTDTIHPPCDYVTVSPGLYSLSEPVVGVDKSESSTRAGDTYIVYPSLALGDADLFCVRSTDGGMTWGPSVRVNNDTVANGRDQFHFWMTVDDSGFVDVVFLDRRNDPNNILCDAYFAQSRDGGRSFKNFKITPQNFDPTITPNGDVRLGEYIGIDARGNRIVPVWVDTHLGNQDIYIAIIDQDSTSTIKGKVSRSDSLKNLNVAVLLFHDNGIDTAFVDSMGNYKFDGLFPGTYLVGLQSGFHGTPDTFSISITSGETIDNKDFRIISTEIAREGMGVPQLFSLSQNYPNPFNPTTMIKYQLPILSRVTLRIYNVLGQVVASLVNQTEPAGYKSVNWNASHFSSGIYFYRVEATSVSNPNKSFTSMKKMILMK